MSNQSFNLTNLIKKAKKGNTEAFEALYKQHKHYVYKVILDFFYQNIPEIDDLVQEVFLKAFKHINTLHKEDAFVSWLAGITLNICKQYVRDRGLLKNKADIVPIEDYEIEEDEAFLPFNILEKKYTHETVLNAIEQLPSRQRLAMLLFYFHDYSHKDLARDFDISISGVKKLLHFGRLNLKEPLRKKLGVGDQKHVVGFGFIFMEYGNTLVSKYGLPTTLVNHEWHQIKEKLQVSKSKLSMIAGSMIVAALLGLTGWFASFTQVEVAPVKSHVMIQPALEKVEVISKQEKRPSIKNTAHVNGEPTNTVNLHFEGEGSGTFGSNGNGLFGGLPQTGGYLLLVLALLLIGVGTGININRVKKKNSLNRFSEEVELGILIEKGKRRKFMRKNQKRKLISTATIVVMMISLLVTTLPMNSMALTQEETQPKSEVEQQAPTPEQAESEVAPQVTNPLEGFMSPFSQGIQSSIEPITPTASFDGVDFNVSVAKSLDGARPADGVFASNDSIDLANVTRFDMFYTYLKIDYANNSGVDLTSTSITMQLPKQGEAGYYEVFSISTAPGNWVSYPNTPTGDGNTNFPANNMSTNATTRLMTWTGGTIADGSTGSIYIKIPMRDPFTKFGIVNYNPILHYTQDGTASTIGESTQFDIAGQNDQPTFSLSKESDLGYVPVEPDADQYYYVKYKVSTNYANTYALPKRAYEFDRFLVSAKIKIIIPAGAEITSRPVDSSISDNDLFLLARTDSFVLRYLKTDFPNATQDISIDGIFNGRFVGDTLPTQDVLGTDYTLTHPIGTGSVIPAATLGKITITKFNSDVSEDALKVGSISFSGTGTVSRTLDTISGDELTYEFNGVEYIKDGSPLPTDYGINNIYINGRTWTGSLDPNNPMSGSITVYFNDGSFEVLKTFTEADMVSGGTLYGGNIPGIAGGYKPPAGKIAKKVVFSFFNTPTGFVTTPIASGYLKGYPTEGADSLRILRATNLYGRDTGSGRPLATGSGDTSYTVSILENTNFQPRFTMERTSVGTVNPGQIDSLTLKSIFSDRATQSFVNPEFDVFLPTGYTFDSYTDQTNEVNGGNLPDGRLKDTVPEIETIPNYNGTGRTLVRIKYTGILQSAEQMQGLLTIRAAQYMSPGNYTIDGYFAAENMGTVNNLSNTYTPYTVDVNDMNGNGQINDYIFGTVSKILNISRGVGTSLYSQIKGSYDPVLTGQGTTKQNTTVDGALTLEYNGATPMNNVQLLSVLPYEGDGQTLYGGTPDGQRVTLAQAVDVSAYPGATVYYNNTPTNDPNAAGWTTIYSNTAQAVRIVLPPAFELISGGIEKVSIPLKLQVPGTTDQTQLVSVQGIGYLPIKEYSNVSPAGLDGASSNVTSLALGINVQVFKDDNGNGIKDTTESWANNTDVEIFNLSDDPATATPLYKEKTNANGVISFIDSFDGVTFNLQGYRVVVHKPSGDYTYVTGIGNVTTDGNGHQGVVFNTSNQIVNVTSAFSPKTMTISGNYWQDYEAVPNGMKDAHDLVTNTAGRTVKLFNVTGGVYASNTTTVAADGSYTLPNVEIGPEYRVEFGYNSANEDPSVLAIIGGNMVTKQAPDILGYTFDSTGMDQDDVQTVNAAMVENGTVTVKFSTDGTNTIGTATTLTRSLPTDYAANIGTTADTTGHGSGTFVVPTGYRLVATESTDKTATINSTTKTNEIVFLVELLESNISGTKTSNPSTPDLHPGDTITYTITVENTGTQEALNTAVTDQVPSNTEFVSADQGGTVDSNGKVSWNIDTLAEDGGIQAVSFTVKILPQKTLGEWNVVNDQAKVNGVSTNSTTDPVTQSVLTSEKTSDIGEGKYIYEGDTITYTITTTNTGVIDSDLVTITDIIPEGTTFVEGSLSDGVTIDGKNLSINKDTLAPGETLTLSFKVTVDKGAKEIGHIDNVAKVNDVDTNKVSIPVGEKTDVIDNNNNNNNSKTIGSILPKTGGYILLGSAILLALLGTGLLIISRRKRRQQ